MKRALFAAALCTTALAGAPARADDDDLEGLLERSVVTTASKQAETASAAPATTYTLSADDLRRWGIRTVDEAIRFLALGATTNQRTRSPDFGARGVLLTTDRNTHVLVLVDGHAINDELAGAAIIDRGIGVPIELVDHIEVVLGPGSVLYGNNAMLGVIHVVTKRGTDWKGVHLAVDAEQPFLVRGMAGAGATFKLFGAPAELTLGVEATRWRFPVTGLPPVDSVDAVSGRAIRWGGADWTHNEAFIPATYARLVAGNFELGVRVGSGLRNHPQMGFDFDRDDSFERDRWVSVDARYTATLSRVADLSVRAYADGQDYWLRFTTQYGQYCLEGQARGCVMDLQGQSRWGGLETQLSLDWLSDRRVVTLVGADARYHFAQYGANTVDAVTGDNPGSLAAFRDSDPTIGVYAQNVWQVADPLTLNVGARYDHVPAFGSAVSPRAAAIMVPWRDAALKGIYSTAFRGPSPGERGFEHPLLSIRAGHLDAEHVRSFEASFEQRFGAQRVSYGVFRTEWDNLVELALLTPQEEAAAKVSGALLPFAPRGLQYRNVGSIDNWGMNFGYDASLGIVKLGATVTVSRALRTSEADPVNAKIPGSPEVFGNARAALEPGDTWPTLGVAMYWSRTAPVYGVDPGAYGPVPYGPARATLRATVSGPFASVRGLAYRLSGQYSLEPTVPSIVGPLSAPTAQNPEPLLDRVPRWGALAGLSYDLDP